MKNPFSDEDRRKAGASRTANVTATRPTTRPGSETTDLEVGDAVRCSREPARSGVSWRYDGREGFVASVNRQTFPSGVTYVEIGVCWFEPTDWAKVSAETWFRADELARR